MVGGEKISKETLVKVATWEVKAAELVREKAYRNSLMHHYDKVIPGGKTWSDQLLGTKGYELGLSFAEKSYLAFFSFLVALKPMYQGMTWYEIDEITRLVEPLQEMAKDYYENNTKWCSYATMIGRVREYPEFNRLLGVRPGERFVDEERLANLRSVLRRRFGRVVNMDEFGRMLMQERGCNRFLEGELVRFEDRFLKLTQVDVLGFVVNSCKIRSGMTVQHMLGQIKNLIKLCPGLLKIAEIEGLKMRLPSGLFVSIRDHPDFCCMPSECKTLRSLLGFS